MFEKLKRLFIIEDKKAKKESKKKPAEVVENPSETVPSVRSKKVSGSGSEPKSISTEPSKKFTDILFGALESNNQQGFDYIEYKESLDSLAKMNMDEATRFKSAFAMAQTMGTTPTTLLDSAKHYRNVLQKEEHKFQEALKNQKNRQINEQNANIDHYNKEINAKQKQLEQLKQSIEADQQSLKKAEQSLQGAEKRIQETKEKFMASYQSLSGQIEADIDKIKKYLK